MSTTFQSFFRATLKRGRRNSRNAAAKSLAESPRDKICRVTLPPLRPPSRLSADQQRVSMSERSESLRCSLNRCQATHSTKMILFLTLSHHEQPAANRLIDASAAPADPTTRRLFTYTPPDCTSRRASLLDGASSTRATRSTRPMPAAHSLSRNLGRRHILKHRQHIVERQRRDVLAKEQRRRLLGTRKPDHRREPAVSPRAPARAGPRALRAAHVVTTRARRSPSRPRNVKNRRYRTASRSSVFSQN